MNTIKKTRFLAATLLSLYGLCSSASAQDFLNKTIEVTVTFLPGGGTDSLARACADDVPCKAQMVRDNDIFKQLITKLNLKAGQ